MGTGFKLTRINLGANHVNIIGLEQYKAHCREYEVPVVIVKQDGWYINGSNGRQKCLGMAMIPVPLPNIGVTIDFKF